MAFVVTAVATAVELGTFAAIATAVSEVGIAMSVVGTVTGNKELTKWGGYLGIAGGVGSLAAGVGTAAGPASESGALDLAGQDISSTAYSGADPMPNFSNSATNSVANDASSFSSDAVNAGQGIADQNMLSSASMPSGNEILPNVANAPDSGGATNYQDYANGPRTPGAPPNPQQAVDSASQMNLSAGGGIQAPGDTSSNGIAQWFKNLDQRTQSTVLQAGAGLAGGLFQGWSAEQKLALEREKFNLDQQKYSTAMTNASAQPTIKFAPTGIINQKAS